MDTDGSLEISFNEWRDFLLYAPSTDIHELIHYWRHSTVSKFFLLFFLLLYHVKADKWNYKMTETLKLVWKKILCIRQYQVNNIYYAFSWNLNQFYKCIDLVCRLEYDLDKNIHLLMKYLDLNRFYLCTDYY